MRLGIPVAAAEVSARAVGLLVTAMLRPNPTSCAVLEEGDSAEPEGLPKLGEFLSDVQYLTRCTELSKLLQQCNISIFNQSPPIIKNAKLASALT